ncbi:putative ribonuclease H-like domain-containing protein [Tanacetum coccineum]
MAPRAVLMKTGLKSVNTARPVNTVRSDNTGRPFSTARVLIVKPHNKTPYELFRGFKPAIGFMKPFGCHVTILNTLDHLGKFDEKSDEGFFVGYSLSSKAFRVYNIRTRKVQENLHIGFLENKPMIEGNGPKWLFYIDSLTQSMNYVPVVAGTFSNDFASIQGVSESSFTLLKPFQTRSRESRLHCNANLEGCFIFCRLNTGSKDISTALPEDNTATPEDLVGPIPTTPQTRIHKDHPIEHVIGDVQSSVKTRRMKTSYSKLGFLSAIYEGKSHQDLHTCFEDLDHPNKVYKVVKALYGLHQALRAWYDTLANYLLCNSFQRGKIDQTLFIKRQKGHILLVQIYVDVIIFGSTKKGVQQKKKDLEKPLVQDGDANDVDEHLYRSMIGSLMYLTTSRPDIIYLKGKPSLGLWYSKDSPLELVAYTDSDYAGATQDRKSTTEDIKIELVQSKRSTGKDFFKSINSDSLLRKLLVINAPCFYNEALASQSNKLFGKDYSNPLMAGSLPKTILCVNCEPKE